MNLQKDSKHVDFSTFITEDNNICPSNVDGMVEIAADNGTSFFLFTEIKMQKEGWHGEGAPRALLAQSKQPNTTVLRINVSGELAATGAILFDPISYSRAYLIEAPVIGWSRTIPTDLEDFLKRFADWKKYARSGKKVLATACFPVI